MLLPIIQRGGTAPLFAMIDDPALLRRPASVNTWPKTACMSADWPAGNVAHECEKQSPGAVSPHANSGHLLLAVRISYYYSVSSFPTRVGKARSSGKWRRRQHTQEAGNFYSRRDVCWLRAPVATSKGGGDGNARPTFARSRRPAGGMRRSDGNRAAYVLRLGVISTCNACMLPRNERASERAKTPVASYTQC